ncbi:hypothetical protein [Microbacterium luticocti]|nr:hypothetical protein [Microbacterium luticocti]
MNELEQTLLFATTTLVLAGTLVVFVVQYIRRYGRKDRGRDRDE